MTEALEQKLADLERRLAHIESKLSVKEKKSPPTPQAKTEVPVEYINAHAGVDSDGRKTFGAGSFLGILAVLCFVLAGAYMVRLAIESGLLTPERQVLLTLLFGFSLIWGGIRLESSDLRYASLLPAAGIVVLHLAVVGAAMLYGIFAPRFAILGSSIISLLSVALFRHFRSALFAVLAAIGAYLVPFLLRISEDPDFISIYFIPLSLGFVLVALSLKYRPFLLFSAYLALWLTHAAYGHAADPRYAALMLGVHFLIFLFGVGFYSWFHREPMREGEAAAFAPLLFFFYGIEHVLLARIIPDYVDWVALGFVGFINVFYLAIARNLQKVEFRSDILVHSFTAIVLIHAFYLNIVPTQMKPLLFLMALMYLAWAPKQSFVRSEALARLFEIGIFLLLVGNFCAVAFQQIYHGPSIPWSLYGISYTAALLLLFFRSNSRQVPMFGIKEGALFALMAGHIQGIITLYSLTQESGSLAVSGAWAVYALMVFGFGFVKRQPEFARSSLIVLMVAAGKALLYDVANASSSVRILCLLLTGLLLYVTGFMFQKIKNWV